MSSNDCGGLSEYSEFFTALRHCLSIPEQRAEIEDGKVGMFAVCAYVSASLSSEQRSKMVKWACMVCACALLFFSYLCLWLYVGLVLLCLMRLALVCIMCVCVCASVHGVFLYSNFSSFNFHCSWFLTEFQHIQAYIDASIFIYSFARVVVRVCGCAWVFVHVCLCAYVLALLCMASCVVCRGYLLQDFLQRKFIYISSCVQ